MDTSIRILTIAQGTPRFNSIIVGFRYRPSINFIMSTKSFNINQKNSFSTYYFSLDRQKELLTELMDEQGES